MADDEFLSMLNHTISIYRSSIGTPNAFGERTTLKGTLIHEDICARVQPLREKFSIEIKGTTVLITHVCYMAVPTEGTVLEADIVVWNSANYKVIGVEDEAGEAHHLKLLMVKI